MTSARSVVCAKRRSTRRSRTPFRHPIRFRSSSRCRPPPIATAQSEGVQMKAQVDPNNPQPTPDNPNPGPARPPTPPETPQPDVPPGIPAPEPGPAPEPIGVPPAAPPEIPVTPPQLAAAAHRQVGRI